MEEQVILAEQTGDQAAEAVNPQPRRRINRAVLFENLWGWFFVSFLIIGTTLSIYVALILSVWMSFTAYNGNTGISLWDALKSTHQDGWYHWYAYMFSPKYDANGVMTGTGASDDFWTTLLNSVIYMIGIPFGMILGLFFAVLISRDIKGSGAYRVIYYGPTVSSVVSISLLWRNLFGSGGLWENWFGVGLTSGMGATAWTQKVAIIIMTVWKGLGGTILLLCAGLNGVNESHKEAASIDGANAWTTFWRISLPQLYPTIFYILVTSVIGGMQIFAEPQLIYGNYPGGDGTVGVTPFVGYIYGIYYSERNFAYCTALGVVLMVIILLLTLVQFAVDSRRDK